MLQCGEQGVAASREICLCLFIHATGFYQAAPWSGKNSVPGFQLCNLQVG